MQRHGQQEKKGSGGMEADRSGRQIQRKVDTGRGRQGRLARAIRQAVGSRKLEDVRGRQRGWGMQAEAEM
jgi:hypothetical protein